MTDAETGARGVTAERHLARTARRLAAAVLCWALPGCGEAGVLFRGTLATDDVDQATLDAAPNPAKRQPLPGGQVFVRIEKKRFYAGCQVPATEHAKASSDVTGAFKTDVIGWGGFAGEDNSLQVCFTKAGFRPHELIIDDASPPEATNGEKYWNIALAPE